MEQDNNNNITEENENKVAVAVMDKEDEVILPKNNDLDIQDLIYEIRGKQVMLDSDLAKLYNYNVKRLNEQVKRNIDSFPTDFMFRLTKVERDYLWSQFATANINKMSRSLPYVFTEHGVTQLSAVLKSPIAVE